MSRIALTDVARQAGVSTSTASRVLNKSPVTVPISEHTRTRVETAASELGYRPSAAARALRTGQTRTVGVLGNSPQAFWLWSEGNDFTSEMMRGMMQAAIEHSYHLTLLTGETAADRMPDFGMVDGILVLNRDLSETPHIAETLAGSGKPVLYLLDYPETQTCHALAPDDIAMGQLATQTLLQAGHQRIGFARTANWDGIFGRRERGWQQAMQVAGIETPATWSIEPDGAAAIDEENLTALVCANSHIARAIRKQVSAKVPADLSLLTLVHADTQGHPPADLAAVTFPLAEIVHTGADRLIRLIQGETIEPQKQLYTPQYTSGPTLKEHLS